MQVLCEQCDAVIPAEDVNLDTLLAKCRACDAVFSIAADFGKPPEPMGRPGGLTVEPKASGIRISRSWRSPVVYFLTFFTIFWDGFLVFWYFLAFTQGGPLIMKVFPALHVACGVGITWFTLANWLNKTIVDADYERVRVRHAPIWWPGNRDIDAVSITQLAVRRSAMVNNGQRSWNLMIDTTDGKRLALVRHITDRDQVEYIKQELDSFLGLQSST